MKEWKIKANMLKSKSLTKSMWLEASSPILRRFSLCWDVLFIATSDKDSVQELWPGTWMQDKTQ